MASENVSLLANQLNELYCIPLSNERYGGYKIELLKQNLTSIGEKFVVCPSCTGIMKNASSSVGKNMCESCCPEKENSTPVESVRETVNNLPCRCPLETKGCGWNGVIGELETHLGMCEHLMVPCPFVDYGCDVGLVKRLEMQLHLEVFSIQHIMGRIMKVEEGSRKLFNDIDFLKTENWRAFEEIDLLKKENASLKKMLLNKKDEKGGEQFLIIQKTIGDKLFNGLQFTISDINILIATKGIIQGPIFIQERCKIQVCFEFETRFYLRLQRIPGDHDHELTEARIKMFHYQLINHKDSGVMFQCEGNEIYPLIIDKIRPRTKGVRLDAFIIDNNLTIWIGIQIEFRN